MTKQNGLIRRKGEDVADSIIAMIRDGVDEDTFDRFCEVFGGDHLNLPALSNLSSTNKIVKGLGLEAAKRILDCVGVETGQTFYVPRLNKNLRGELVKRIEELLTENGITAAEIALVTGVTVRTVFRCKARMRKHGRNLGDPSKPRRSPDQSQPGKAESIIRQLLIEGHPPSLLRDIMNIPAAVILTIRAELLKQGKLN